MDKARRYSRKKYIVLILIAVTVLGITAAGIYRYNRPIPSLKATVAAPTIAPKTVSLPWTESGETAIATSGNKVLGQGVNADKVVPTASIAKLITILTVLQKYPLKAGESGPMITLGAADVQRQKYYDAIDGSTAAVSEGERITEYQMIQAMLLPSANNMADSLAIWAYGSLDGYRTAAQDVVNRLGMGHTTVGSDASGFLPDTTSTANDLVLLGQAALKQSVITEIASQKIAVIPVAGTIYNTNPDLGEGGVNGLKTGTSDQAGNCFLFSATHTFTNGQTETFVGVIMNSPTGQSRFTEAKTLLGAVYNAYQDVLIAKAGQKVGSVTSVWGGDANIVVASDMNAFAWVADKQAATATVSVKGQSLDKAQTVGALSSGSHSVPLVALDEIKPPTLWWRIFHS